MGLNIFTKQLNIFKKPKSINKMNLKELRKAELLAEGRRRVLEKKAMKLAQKKQETFNKGAKATSLELRRTLAQQFDMTTTEERMVGRQLNLASKEVIIVSRVRTAKQNTVEATIQPQDLKGIEMVMDNDSVAAEAYQEILDDALEASRLDEGKLWLSEAGKDALAAWEGLDTGAFDNTETAMAEADRNTRERMSTAAG